jgi:hypothetical protein
VRITLLKVDGTLLNIHRTGTFRSTGGGTSGGTTCCGFLGGDLSLGVVRITLFKIDGTSTFGSSSVGSGRVFGSATTCQPAAT